MRCAIAVWREGARCAMGIPNEKMNANERDVGACADHPHMTIRRMIRRISCVVFLCFPFPFDVFPSAPRSLAFNKLNLISVLKNAKRKTYVAHISSSHPANRSLVQQRFALLWGRGVYGLYNFKSKKGSTNWDWELRVES